MRSENNPRAMESNINLVVFIGVPSLFQMNRSTRTVPHLAAKSLLKCPEIIDFEQLTGLFDALFVQITAHGVHLLQQRGGRMSSIGSEKQEKAQRGGVWSRRLNEDGVRKLRS
jgi:hypothetical protein